MLADFLTVVVALWPIIVIAGFVVAAAFALERREHRDHNNNR